jgi:Fe-S-cluster containining protein
LLIRQFSEDYLHPQNLSKKKDEGVNSRDDDKMSEEEKKEEEGKKPDTSSVDESKKVETEEKKPKTDTPVEPKRKYVFNCTKCGQCCEKRQFVPISFTDIRNWTKSGTINAVFPNLQFQTAQSSGTEEKQSFLTLILAGTEKGCSMFDQENRLCNIYHSMPLECIGFPLGYNGKNYFIKDKAVPGLGKGTMTKERLIEDRENARQDFEAQVETQMILPLLYSLFMQNLMEQQQKVRDDMPEEKRKQLDDLLKNSKPDST